ncbi:MAG: hypothetical protein M3Y87_29560 [Myxococcota bacterium]|nr:hypothetical protein [Myxococcota bacterium]
MSRFLAGFAAATVLWVGALAALHLELGWGPPLEEELVVDEAPIEVAAEEPEERSRKRRGGRRGRRGSTASADGTSAVPRGEATTGDDLREGEMRMIDGEGVGGEQQLTGGQIDTAFDGAMGRIRRCFILAAGDEPVRGRLVFGMRIGASGRATAVNLSGPAAVTTGDSGDCLRSAARAIQFPPFDGPEMVVRYPITLE